MSGKALAAGSVASGSLATDPIVQKEVQRIRLSVAILSLLLPFVLCLAGCGDQGLPTYPVKGQLKFEDGTVPMFGDIEFYNAEHKVNARGKIGRDGSFTVGTHEENDGAVLGSHKIVIIQQVGSHFTAKTQQQVTHDHGKLVDRAYLDYRSSGLECTIVDGENKVELILRKNPRQTEDGMPK